MANSDFTTLVEGRFESISSSQERLGFLHHEPLQSPIELGKQFFVGLGEVHVPQVQPRLREIGQKAVEPPVLEQALGFLAQSSGIVGQFGLESQAEQFPLRQGPIKKKRPVGSRGPNRRGVPAFHAGKGSAGKRTRR